MSSWGNLASPPPPVKRSTSDPALAGASSVAPLFHMNAPGMMDVRSEDPVPFLPPPSRTQPSMTCIICKDENVDVFSAPGTDKNMHYATKCEHLVCGTCYRTKLKDGERCSYPGCGKHIEKSKMTSKPLDVKRMEEAAAVRREICEDWNLTVEDFVDAPEGQLNAYNRYLETRENLIIRKIENPQDPTVEAENHEFRQAFQAQIKLNRARQLERAMVMRQLIEEEERIRVQQMRIARAEDDAEKAAKLQKSKEKNQLVLGERQTQTKEEKRYAARLARERLQIAVAAGEVAPRTTVMHYPSTLGYNGPTGPLLLKTEDGEDDEDDLELDPEKRAAEFEQERRAGGYRNEDVDERALVEMRASAQEWFARLMPSVKMEVLDS